MQHAPGSGAAVLTPPRLEDRTVTRDVTLDIVIPAHNEEDRIDRTLRVYRDVCPERTRLLVALDGCSDGTAAVVRAHQRDDPRIVLLEFPKVGKGGVIAETFRRCSAPLVGFVDADCASPPGELLLLAEAAANADGAIASRRHPAAVTPGRRGLKRRIFSAGFAAGVRALFHLPYRDTQCGAKVLRRAVVEQALPFVSARDFLFDVDLLIVARKLGFRIVEVPTVWIDQDGSRLHATSAARRMFASALRLWLHHRVLPVEAGPLSGGDVIDIREHAVRHAEGAPDSVDRAPA